MFAVDGFEGPDTQIPYAIDWLWFYFTKIALVNVKFNSVLF